MVILHISDLHFGVPTPPAETVARQLALGSLGEHLANIEAEWRPTAVLVGGDLAWSGSRDEFDLCGEWLDALLRRLEVPKSALAACAGNHDISRQAIRMPRPATSAAADNGLSVPFSAELLAPFENYASFCRGFGIPPLNVGAETSHIVGARKLDQCNLIVLNTAWFCRDQDDRGRLWLGYPLLTAMSAAGQLANNGVEPTTVPQTIALLHHPFEWLHDSELNAYSRPSTLDYVDKGMAPVLILKKEPFPRRRRDESTTYQLFRGWNAYLAMTASNDAARTRYLRAVDAAFGDPEFDRPLLLSVLHELGQPASLQQLVAIITEWPNAQISNDSLVLDAIASALSDAAVADQERRALQTAIHAALGQFAAFGDQWGRSSALRQVGLPLLQWSFGAKEHDAMAFEVFSQGFVSLFKTGDVSDVEGTFEALAPLMERLDPKVIGRFVRASGQAQGRLAHTVGWLVRALVAANPREHESN